MITLQPLLKTSYTQKGNEYKKSNLGKFAAGTSIAAATLVYGGETAYKGVKKLYNKVLTINIKKPKISAKAIKEGAQSIGAKAAQAAKDAASAVKNSVNKETVQELPKTAKSLAGKVANLFMQGFGFIKTNLAKINKENLKKAGEFVVEFSGKPAVKKAAGVAAGLALILAAGYLFDNAINRFNAHRADKKA